jgi:hypothetical protein
MTEDIYDAETGELVTNLPSLASGQRDSSALAILERTKIESLVATAWARPRSIKRAVEMLKSIVTIDEKSAEECIYALPRGGKPIRGPSARFAEALLVSWGNCSVEARVTHVDRTEKVIFAEATYRDLETNVIRTASVRRRISGKGGQIFNDDMIAMTGSAACSIASRNATLAGVPKPVWRLSYELVEATIAGTAETLSARREKAVAAFAMFGVKPEQVFESLGVKGIEDIQLDHILTMRGMYSAIKNEESSVEEIFGRKGGGISASDEVKDPLAEEAEVDTATETVKTDAEPKKRGRKPKESPGPNTGDKAAGSTPEPTPPKEEGANAPASSSTGPETTGNSGTALAIDAQALANSVAKGLVSSDLDGLKTDQTVAQQAATETTKEPTKAPTATGNSYPDEASYRAHLAEMFASATSATALKEAYNDKAERAHRAQNWVTTEISDAWRTMLKARMGELEATST